MNSRSSISIKQIVPEDFVNYKRPSMFIATSLCDWKCCKEADLPIGVCQNCPLAQEQTITMDIERIVCQYLKNSISEAVVFGGLEPMLQYEEVYNFIDVLRSYDTKSDIVIYTGYNHDEVFEEVEELSVFEDIIFKFGRYIPGHTPHYDEILGVELASDNQYARRFP